MTHFIAWKRHDRPLWLALLYAGSLIIAAYVFKHWLVNVDGYWVALAFVLGWGAGRCDFRLTSGEGGTR